VLPFKYGVPEPGRLMGLCRMPAIERNRGTGRIYRMSQQPELKSPPLAPNPAPTPGSESTPMLNFGPMPGPKPEASPAPQHTPRHKPQRIPRWLERAELFLRVSIKMYIGLAVCYAPWSRTFWDQNPLFLQFPTLLIFAANGAVRGIVSGFGLLTLWIAFQDVLRHRDG